MFEGEHFAFVGPGVMAEAMVNGLLLRAGVGPRSLTAGGPRPERLEELATHYGISTNTDIGAAAAGATVVVLSVKPQSLPAVLDRLNGGIPAGALVLSIVAGARLSSLMEKLGHA